jgi:hypothetical protein
MSITQPPLQSLILDREFYKRIYVDLKGLDGFQLTIHWLTVGYHEKRCPSFSALSSTLPHDFDAVIYLNLHQDLINAFNNNSLKAAVHYYQNGRFEQRIYKTSDINLSDRKGQKSDWEIQTNTSELAFYKGSELIAAFYKVV